MKHAVYEVVNEDGDVVYIGSTSKHTLAGLEDNHRKWLEKWGLSGATTFRQALTDNGQDWTFRWAQEPSECSKEYIEICEGALIRYVKPLYNFDMNPYESSVKYNRYARTV